MNIALVVDLDGGREFSADAMVMGRILAAYPLMAAQASRSIKRIYLVSDSPPIKAVALQYEAVIIDPPPGESAPELGGRVAHAWRFIKDDLKEEEPPELVAILFTHAAAVTTEAIDAGIDLLRSDPRLDAAMTVTRSEWCEPRYALQEAGDSRLAPLLAAAPPPRAAWFPDWAVSVLRPRVLDAMRAQEPIPWLGSAVAPLKREGSCPVDHAWQVPQLEAWLKRNGVIDIAAVLEPQPKPQPMPRQDRR